MNFLNIGCGGRYHPDWNNIDFTTRSKFVIAHDLSKGIPAADNTYDLVYQSHLLEHFSRNDAPRLLYECLRVLRSGGILRIVVPDLESIALEYLNALEQAANGADLGNANYDWMLLELLDQTVRNYPGGAMATYLKQETISNADFVIQRLGTEAKKIIMAQEHQQQQQPEETDSCVAKLALELLIKPAYRFIRYSTYRRECFLKAVLGQEYEMLKIGRFRQQGEIHQWMYDRYSLQRLLEQCGFSQIVQRTAATSYVADWSNFCLDTEPDGSIYKPDSIFIEAIKPSA